MLIGNRMLYTDSTHLKVNANKRHFEVHQVELRSAAGKKSLKRDEDDPTLQTMKEVKVSTVDPDAGFMARGTS